MVRKDDVQLPWSDEGWYADDAEARETDVDRYAREGEGRFRSRAHDHRRAGYAIVPATHNPYFNFVFPPLAIYVSVFLIEKMQDTLWFVIPFVVLLLVAFVGIAVVSALRIPAWHRARRRAREYIAEHGGKFPADLRWYT